VINRAFLGHASSIKFARLVQLGKLPVAGAPAVIELSTYAFAVLRKDEDFVPLSRLAEAVDTDSFVRTVAAGHGSSSWSVY
jgi:hypothetical protein